MNTIRSTREGRCGARCWCGSTPFTSGIIATGRVKASRALLSFTTAYRTNMRCNAATTLDP